MGFNSAFKGLMLLHHVIIIIIIIIIIISYNLYAGY